MGSWGIELTLAGTPSFSAIEKQLESQREEDRDCNGYQDGYSGDWQTVRDIKDHTYKTFDSYNEAQDYCMKNCEKREAVAVRYRFMDKSGFKPSEKFNKLQGKYVELQAKYRTLEAAPFKVAKFVKCEGCESKINSQRVRGHKCPVCGEGDFRPLGLQRKLTKMKLKIESLALQIAALGKVERKKGLKKFGKVGTLVAGWAAS